MENRDNDQFLDKVKYEHVFDHIGHFRKSQVYWYLYLAYTGVISGYAMYVNVFSQYSQKFTCSGSNMTCGSENGSDTCGSFVFDELIMKTTVISDFNLVCDREYIQYFTGYAL